MRLNAPTGAWCSLTVYIDGEVLSVEESQCTYRCVVLPDTTTKLINSGHTKVSMHLQVRGAP